jgi:isopentenyl diphosphate isomerase/L-lactate dehydrogenase-like FMN-dependent dehydrogenase
VVRNHEAFSHYEIRAHRFNDVSRLDTSRAVFGNTWPSPVYLSAVSSQRAFHPKVNSPARARGESRSMQMMLSTGTSTAVETVSEARGAPLWQQLYPTDDWAVTEGLVRRAEKAGCTAIALTVDSPGARNLETLERATGVDNRQCTACHGAADIKCGAIAQCSPVLDVSRVTSVSPPGFPPSYLAKSCARGKGSPDHQGIVTGEDAAIAIDNGADGIVVVQSRRPQ